MEPQTSSKQFKDCQRKAQTLPILSGRVCVPILSVDSTVVIHLTLVGGFAHLVLKGPKWFLVFALRLVLALVKALAIAPTMPASLTPCMVNVASALTALMGVVGVALMECVIPTSKTTQLPSPRLLWWRRRWWRGSLLFLPPPPFPFCLLDLVLDAGPPLNSQSWISSFTSIDCSCSGGCCCLGGCSGSGGFCAADDGSGGDCMKAAWSRRASWASSATCQQLPLKETERRTL